MAHCTECGTELTGRQKVACSKECRNQRLFKSEAYKAAQERQRGKSRKPYDRYSRQRKCEHCGGLTRNDRRFCSRICGGVHRRMRGTASCVKCQKERTLTPTASPCAECFPPERKHWPRTRVFIPECVTCGERFVTVHTISTCSERCTRLKRREDRARGKAARRARKKAAFVANVWRRDIYERDDWTCQLCKEPLDRQAEVPEWLAPTIDHIIPLAAGGTHEPANVQAAHFICNARKGDRGGGEQLRLVG